MAAEGPCPARRFKPFSTASSVARLGVAEDGADDGQHIVDRVRRRVWRVGVSQPHLCRTQHRACLITFRAETCDPRPTA